VIHIQSGAARFVIAFAFLLPGFALPLTGHAQGQSGNGWFVPEQAKPGGAAAGRPQQPIGQRQPSPAQLGPAQPGPAQPGPAQPGPIQPGADIRGADADRAPPPGTEPLTTLVEPQGQLPPLQVQLPPMPEIPSIPKGSPTPAAIIGVLSVPDVLRISTAYQLADKELAARRGRVNDDGQKEQNTLRELGQSFANERGKLTPEQIRTREKEYADRVNDSRRKFSERARIVQEAGQYVMAQIERVIEQVAQQVAASRGVNLVLNRAQVLGTTADFDLTPQVADVLNKILPTVVIPPDGISPTKFNVPVAGPRASAAPDVIPAKKN
jgi:Skp family chaperone for outer membrane proteins